MLRVAIPEYRPIRAVLEQGDDGSIRIVEYLNAGEAPPEGAAYVDVAPLDTSAAAALLPALARFEENMPRAGDLEVMAEAVARALRGWNLKDEEGRPLPFSRELAFTVLKHNLGLMFRCYEAATKAAEALKRRADREAADQGNLPS